MTPLPDAPGGTVNPLNLQDYLDAASEAARRTRVTIIAMVVTSVLILSAFLNSMDESWAHRRLLTLANRDDTGLAYRNNKIGPPPPHTLDELVQTLGPQESARFQSLSPEDQKKYHDVVRAEYEKRYEAFYGALARVHVESATVVRVPFFGITVDANDAGVLGGVAVATLLVLLRFCLAREVDNLLLGFQAAAARGHLDPFYHLLAMHQVFTVPQAQHQGPHTVTRGRGLWLLPKVIVALPIAALALVVANDALSLPVGLQLHPVRTMTHMVMETVLLVANGAITAWCVWKMLEIDKIWSEMYASLTGGPATPTPTPASYVI